jgi:hypothetical protein
MTPSVFAELERLKAAWDACGDPSVSTVETLHRRRLYLSAVEDHHAELLAAARRLEELTDALAHLDKLGGIVVLRLDGEPTDEHHEITADGILHFAGMVGWKATT